jgi:hypothetical protein
MNSRSRITLSVFGVLLLQGCPHPSQPRVAPVPLPENAPEHANVQGTLLAARAYADGKKAEQVFGFDIRGAGLLPVRFAVDNQGAAVMSLHPEQIFLMDREGQAWPLLSAEQARNRVGRALEFRENLQGSLRSAEVLGAVGAATGFALGIMTPYGNFSSLLKGAAVGVSLGALDNALGAQSGQETEILRDLGRKNLGNLRILPGELVHGYLFFPGREEARSAVNLRLGVEMDGYPQVIHLPLP